MQPRCPARKKTITPHGVDDACPAIDDRQSRAKEGEQANKINQHNKKRAAVMTTDSIERGCVNGEARDHVIHSIADRSNICHQDVKKPYHDHRSKHGTWNVLVWIFCLLT